MVATGVKGSSYVVLAFLFSSRRRHMRYWRDWSSDGCSSDLLLAGAEAGLSHLLAELLVDLAEGVVQVPPRHLDGHPDPGGAEFFDGALHSGSAPRSGRDVGTTAAGARAGRGPESTDVAGGGGGGGVGPTGPPPPKRIGKGVGRG